ncbi:EamA family transporter [Sphingobacterium wenxiniae]|uniref:Threonine/homoserine efflux transporter RhtA n=1 Tax=Sphingobacterium wenxiniae TaxID=683125 RepID=A0A1I6UU71_9SPHI|nr:DMT family transporter [Sphingobacterium wenxiniae]SFT05008.1 Threonine/homoserine efflux transporter RhtA [Sphingobacterium wenxiniae]
MSTFVKIKGIAAVTLGAASFGILSTFVKKAYKQDFTLAEVTGTQVLLGAAFLWLAFFLTNKKTLTKKKYTHPFWLIMLCGMSTGAVSILYYRCVELVPASIAIVLLMQYIWIGALLEWLLFKSPPSKVQVIGSIFVIFGTLLSTGIIERGTETISTTGILYGLSAATSFSLFIILNGRVGNDYPVLKKSALMITGASILVMLVLTPVSLLSLGTWESILPYALVLSLFGTVIPPVLFAYGMPKTGYSLGSILSSVELPVAVMMSYFVLHEHVSPLQWSGVIFILIVIILINTYKRK